MDGWVGHVGWPIADVWPTKWSSVQLAVWRRTGKVRRSKTSVLPLCYATKIGWRLTVSRYDELDWTIYNTKFHTKGRPSLHVWKYLKHLWSSALRHYINVCIIVIILTATFAGCKQPQVLLHTEETCTRISLLFVFDEIFAALFGGIWKHYSAHYSDQIKYQ